MKKVFVQFRQWILKHKKRLIYGSLALFVGLVCFFDIGGIGIQNETFAAETATQREEFEKLITEKTGSYNFYKEAVYILVYPILFLAGKLVDNSLVYGEIFGFDAVLWQLWNIVRNLANFALGFMFLFYVFNYLTGRDKNKDWKWIISRSLFAGIGIQASWFIMAVLIDLSTILIYGVGGLPISVLSSTETLNEEYNPHVMKTVVSVNADDLHNPNIYLVSIPPEEGNTQSIYISDCETFSAVDKETYIFAPKMIYYRDGIKENGGKFNKTEELKCTYYGSLYVFTSLFGNVGEKIVSCSNLEDCKTKQTAYETAKSNAIDLLSVNDGQIQSSINAGQILRIGYTGTNFGLDINNRSMTGSTKQLSQLITDKKNKSFVGAFTSLYASLLESGRGMIDVNNKSIYVQYLGCIVTLLHMLAIAIPLLAALLVFIMRIGIIWVAIALSPMIVLLTAFDLGDKFKDNKALTYFKLDNLIGIIMAPAVICFAVSLSAVLVKTIEQISYNEIETKDFIFGGLIEVDLAGVTINLGRTIIGVMGIAISRFLVWGAIKLSKLGSGGVITSLEGLATSAIGNIGIVPVPGKDGKVEMLGASSILGTGNNPNIIEKMATTMQREYDRGEQKALDEFLNPEKNAEKAEKTRNANRTQGYIDGLKAVASTTRDWTEEAIGEGEEKMKFSALSDSEKENIINQINGIQEKDVVDALGRSKKDVKIGDKTYTYDQNDHKYKTK